MRALRRILSESIPWRRGSRAGRRGGIAAALACSAVVAVLAAAPAGAQSAASVVAAGPLGSAVTAGVDDFRFSEYSADFVLDRDAQGHSTLTTVETFVAQFPDADQNRGMQRAIPLDYEGHPTDLALVSVTDGDGVERPVETESDDGFLVVTSAGDGFVRGSQTYVFTYTQRNVTLAGESTDSGEDEFYWDTTGTGWRQSFDRYDVRVELAGGLADAATGTAACYRGPEGATQACSTGRDGAVVVASGDALAPGENVTIAVGFAPGTFVPREDGYLASGWSWLQLAGVLMSLIALGAAIRRRATVLKDAPGRSSVIAEYDPPRAGIFLSAALRGKAPKGPTAAFLDAAVRGMVRIEEVPGAGRKQAFRLRVLDPATEPPRRAARPRPIAPDDQRFLDIAFGAEPRPGAVRDLSGKDTVFGKAVSSFLLGLSKRVREAGLRRSGTVVGSVLVIVIAVAGLAACFVGGVILLDQAYGGPLPLVLLLASVLTAAAVAVLVSKVPLTAEGAELRDHLAGLELYIRLAEADRLAMLQSPRGADRRSLGPVEVVEVSERLLPWAVLLGLESQWSEALAVAYERAGETPLWYSGSGGFQAAAFAGSVSSFSSSASSFVGSSSSSSSGGAGGGGSSGGGGGGGGGGGV